MKDVQESALDHARRLLMRKAWYCGRFAGACGMLRQPEVYRQSDVMELLMEALEDYEKESEEGHADQL